MSDESTTPDLVDLTRRFAETSNGGDLDALMGFFAPDAVWDMSQAGMGTFEGTTAIRGFLEDWLGGYERYHAEVLEVLDLGKGVVFLITRQTGLLTNSTDDAVLRQDWAYPLTWVNGTITRMTTYADIDEARAAAERLAVERE
jgi:ketosteroid isomerase-like protein